GRSGGEVRTALVAHLAQVEPDEARRRLAEADGRVRGACAKPQAAPSPPTPLPQGERGERPLYLGIDGGGTHTVALLAGADGAVLGRGEAGPSNLHAVGVEPALRSLENAVAAAFAAAKLAPQSVTAACLGLAGADRPWERS